MNIETLITEKSALLLKLEDLKRTKSPRKAIEEVASLAAGCEITLADHFMSENRRDDAATSLISAASCLLDAKRERESARLLRKALFAAITKGLSTWIKTELAGLTYVSIPAAIFNDTEVNIDGNDLLRIPQIDAYKAATSHFLSSNEHAIIQLPVGCGKTGTMSIIPFGTSRGRVLAIAPNLEVCNNLARNFEYTNQDSFLKKAKVLANGHGPSCATLERAANIHDCDASDFIVTNIQQLVSARSKNWLDKFTPDYFDMIFIDEGHHNVADSWQETLNCFPSAKIVSFTATPLRSDGKPVDGKRIYRFPIAEAIRHGYICRLASRCLHPSEIYFEYRGSRQRHTIEEVLRLREQDWFSRGVALAPECNRNIVDVSIQCMRELRSEGKVHHQIIAAACSIDHAKAIRSLYIERGITAEVIHSKMAPEEQDAVRTMIRRGELDAVVQVQMFGEGADYPTLGVAAIFRPFRHLVPYIQFVGRVMRVLHDSEPGHPDNRAFVVSHVGLNVDRWWTELKTLDEDDELFFTSIAEGNREFEDTLDNIGNEIATKPPSRRRFMSDMKVLQEVIEHFVEEGFLQGDREALVDDIAKLLELRGISLETLGLSREEIIHRIAEQAKPKSFNEGSVERAQVQPQRERQEARRRLDERVRAGAKQLLNELGLTNVGYELVRKLKIQATNNLAAAIVLLNLEVQDVLGVGPNERDQLDVLELKRAHDLMDDLVDRVADRYRSS